MMISWPPWNPPRDWHHAASCFRRMADVIDKLEELLHVFEGIGIDERLGEFQSWRAELECALNDVAEHYRDAAREAVRR